APAVSPNPPPNIPQSQAPREPVEPAAPPAVAATPAHPPSPPQVTEHRFPKRSRKSSVTMTPEVQRLNIKNGNFTFLDGAGRMLARFTGVDFRSSLRSELAIRGTAKI